MKVKNLSKKAFFFPLLVLAVAAGIFMLSAAVPAYAQDLPDLIVERVCPSTSPEGQLYYTNDPAFIQVEVTNLGAYAGPFKIALYANETLIGKKNYLGMGGGEGSLIVTFPWNPSIAGEVTLKAIVDSDNEVSESDETNNEKVKKVTLYNRPDPVWVKMDSPTEKNLNGVWGAGNEFFAVGGSSTIIHYDGQSWSIMDSPVEKAYFKCIWGSSASDVFVGGSKGGKGIILHYDGAWHTMDIPPEVSEAGSGTISGIWGFSDKDVYAVNTNGYILHYDGNAWQVIKRMTITDPFVGDLPVPFDDIWGSSDQDIFAVSSGYDCIIHYDGQDWSKMIQYEHPMYLGKGIWGSSSRNVFASARGQDLVSEDGCGFFKKTVLHYDGTEWKPMEDIPQGENPNTAIWGDSAENVFVAGGSSYGWCDIEDGNCQAVLRSSIIHYNGTSWSVMGTPVTGAPLHGIWGSSSDVFAVGEKGTILHYGPPAVDYTLTTAIDPAGSGTVELDPPGGTYPAGTTVTLAAYATEGYAFDHWSGDLSGSNNPATITMDANKNITAHFVPAGPQPDQPDVNGDGQVNILDMVLIGQKWDETGSPGWIKEDVNKDGKIDVLDMILVGQHWTG